MLKHRDHSCRDEGGFAVITVILLSVALITIGTAAMVETGQNLDNSTARLVSVQATASANAGLSAGYLALASAPDVQAFPCTLWESMPAGASTALGSYATSIQYYAATGNPPSSASTASCSSVQDGDAVPEEALITSVGTGRVGGTTATQTMRSLVTITPNAVGYAIFSDSSFSVSNGTSISDPSGSPIDIYVNGQVTCANAASLAAGIISTSSVDLANSCDISGNLWNDGQVTMANSSEVGGSLLAAGSGSDVYMSNIAQIDGNATASGGIFLSNSATTKGAYTQDDPNLPTPPSLPFPELTLDSPAWGSAGYTIEAPDNDCNPASDPASVYAELASLATAPSPVVIQTSCPIDLANNQRITVDSNVAIFSSGGFNFSNNAKIVSSSAAVSHHVYLVVPYSSTDAHPSCSSGINLANATTIQAPLVAFLYTPCGVTTTNNTSYTGQVFAGEINTANAFSLTYAPVTPVPGLSLPSPAAAGSGGSYSIAVVSRYSLSGS